MSNLQIIKGDLFDSNCKTLVNTVNIVGVMGKGVALEFKKRFPDMYIDYVNKCKRGELVIGKPYLWRDPIDHLLERKFVLNFPTKAHWKNPSELEYITRGLDYFIKIYKDLPITSIAFPPLGCGNGGLNWDIVKPIMIEYLSDLDIRVEIYKPIE